MINKLNLTQLKSITKFLGFTFLFLMLSSANIAAQSFLPADQAISVLESEVQTQNQNLEGLNPSDADYKSEALIIEARLESLDALLAHFQNISSTTTPSGGLPAGLSLITPSLDETFLREMIVSRSQNTAVSVTESMYQNGNYGTAENATLRNYLFALITN